MKKSELTQLTQIIEHLVAREVRKQLPTIIAETFQNMMGGKRVVAETQQPEPQSVQTPINEEVQEDAIDLKASLRELFAGTTVMGPSPAAENKPRPPRKFTKDPVLNQILNETTDDLRQREGLVGMAAFQGGYSPSVALAAGAMMQAPSMGAGPMMDESEVPSFARGIPTMPNLPVGRPPVLREGQESTHAPMAAIPEGISVLDVARSVPLQAPVAQALTKNYSQMMKLIDSKKKARIGG